MAHSSNTSADTFKSSTINTSKSVFRIMPTQQSQNTKSDKIHPRGSSLFESILTSAHSRNYAIQNKNCKNTKITRQIKVVNRISQNSWTLTEKLVKMKYVNKNTFFFAKIYFIWNDKLQEKRTIIHWLKWFGQKPS